MQETSHYHKFYNEHKKFLRKNGEAAPEKTRKRPLRWIEQEGIECSLWPHLYWKSPLCETVARMAHEARRAKQRRPASSQSTVVEDPSADEGSSEGGEEAEQEQQEANEVLRSSTVVSRSTFFERCFRRWSAMAESTSFFTSSTT